MLNRRQFTTHLAASAAALPLVAGAARSQAGTDPGPPGAAATSDVDVLVIGAGLSGLESALLLEEMGAKVQVIEGRQRIGGRVYTLFDRAGFPEVGGNGFAAGYGRVLNRARALGLPLFDSTPRRIKHPKLELALGSRILQREEWSASPLNPLTDKNRARMPWEFGGGFVAANNPLHAVDDWLSPASAPLDVSMRDWLAGRGVDEASIQLCWSTNPYFGSSAYDISALQCLYNDIWTRTVTQTSNASFSIEGGNQKLPFAMEKKLKREVHLGREVMGIRDGGALTEVVCRDGSSYRAKLVVCSVPFSVLRHVRFDPVLTGAQAEAVTTLPYMVNTLVFFTPKRRFWESDGLSPTMWTDGPAGTVMGQRFGKDDDEITAIVANPRGIAASWLDRLAPQDAIALVKAEIERLRPAAKGALEHGAIHSWARDPFAGGDWSVFGPGQIQRFARNMAAPHGRILFCGEHTARANRGMEGALESAERVVLEASEKLG
jgi:monoamine oxidase